MCVHAVGERLGEGCLSDHLCLWVDGAVGGHLYHACVPYMSECVWKRITDGLQRVRKDCLSQLVVMFRGAYETQLAVCESLVYFCLSDCGTAHESACGYPLQWETTVLCPLTAGSTIPMPLSPTNRLSVCICFLSLCTSLCGHPCKVHGVLADHEHIY